MNGSAITYQVSTNTFGFNGQERKDDYKGKGNHNHALYWEYDTRIGRRWNLDPVDQINISNYATMANSPISNVDPNGDYFFGLIGSTRKQRHSAETFATGNDGKVKDFWKRSIHVDYSKGFTAPDGAAGVQGLSQYFNKDGSSASPFGEIRAYTPSAMTKWGESQNFIGKISYSFVDGFYVTAQNLGGRQLLGDGNAYHLGGETTTPSENMGAFVDVTTSFIPSAPEVYGLAYLKKLNCAQFSKFFKGTIVARMPAGNRGVFNKGLNWGITKWNEAIPSGQIVRDLSETVSDEINDKSKDSK